MLSLRRYGWLCVLGGEVAYIVCLLGGYLPLRSARGTELHHALFETLPGFVWGQASSREPRPTAKPGQGPSAFGRLRATSGDTIQASRKDWDSRE